MPSTSVDGADFRQSGYNTRNSLPAFTPGDPMSASLSLAISAFGIGLAMCIAHAFDPALTLPVGLTALINWVQCIWIADVAFAAGRAHERERTQ